jgi:dephospho-CoA kinase
LLGLGTVGIFTAADGGQVVWSWIARPEAAAERVREAMAECRRASRSDSGSSRNEPSTHQPESTDIPMLNPPSSPDPETRASVSIPILGLAGGIGAGKSTVARAFERLGCHVIDSDVRAKAALEIPRVREQLVQWWGTDILTKDQRVDRAKVASIIFSDPAERERLEALVHPIVRQDRARMIEEAAAAGAAGIIVDAPLLFEAGVDQECDAVVYVDTPREERLRRVRESRNWTQAEFDRRESSQLPLEEKRRRCRFVIDNGQDSPELESQARAILGQMTGSS